MLAFPAKIRLRKPREFDCVFQSGKRFIGFKCIFIVATSDRSYPRLGMAISKKKCPRSVDRNHVKRLIRERFRLNQHQLSGVDLVVLLKSRITNSHDEAITKCLDKQFTRLIAYCAGQS